jgi:hypothetical protein
MATPNRQICAQIMVHLAVLPQLIIGVTCRAAHPWADSLGPVT